MYATDRRHTDEQTADVRRQTSDVRQHHRLMPHLLGAGIVNIRQYTGKMPQITGSSMTFRPTGILFTYSIGVLRQRACKHDWQEC